MKRVSPVRRTFFAVGTILVTRAKAIAFIISSIFLVAWAFPIMRAISLVKESQLYVAETGSHDAIIDLRFGTQLLVSYLLTLIAVWAISWLFARRPSRLYILPFALVAYPAVEVWRFRPEAPIVFLPLMQPWRPAIWGLVAVTVASIVSYTKRRHPPDCAT